MVCARRRAALASLPMRFLIACVVVLSLACVSATEGIRNPNCWYPGDTMTVAITRDVETKVTVDCTWLIAKKLTCFDVPIGRATAQDCVIGRVYP